MIPNFIAKLNAGITVLVIIGIVGGGALLWRKSKLGIGTLREGETE
jgi:hypothetical protein